MKTEIVSFYCDIGDKTYYSDHARRLRINCNEHNMPHDIRELPSLGEYRLNCLAKPKFILDILMEKKKPFVWMDVDSILHDELKVFDEMEGKCDIGFAYQAIISNLNLSIPKASPIYVSYNDLVIEFLNFWITSCEENIKSTTQQKVFDHEILMAVVLPIYLPKLKIAALPINYAIWPGTKLPEGFPMKRMITMGISDNESKEQSLREMGLTQESIDYNLARNL